MESNLLQDTFTTPSDTLVYVAEDVTVIITSDGIVIDFTQTDRPDVVVARQTNG